MAQLRPGPGRPRASPWRRAQEAARRGRETAAVPGREAAREALAAGLGEALYLDEASASGALVALAAEAERRGVPVRRASKAALSALVGGVPHQGVVVIVRPYPTYDVAAILERARAKGEAPLLVLAAGLEDPRNLGALARSAEGAGAHGLVIPARRAAPVSPAAVRASAGALLHLPVAVVANARAALRELQAAGVWAWGADPEGAALYSEVDWRAPAAIVVGGEGRGLPRALRAACDGLVRIPMAGRVASLNAAVAAAVMLYEALRQRRAGR
ncbi:MAG: 23S rRNA (guanosine(2251)-2'-O)-methyltransferase RlmB [Clostridia bacterium]|nr:23S rRNA (guanosine(2251)-2'-O)-methyltransferase RlmB [Clostridia bacterium]